MVGPWGPLMVGPWGPLMVSLSNHEPPLLRQAQDERDAVCGKEPRGYVSSGSSHRQIVRVISSGASMPSRTRKRLGSCSAIAR